MSAAVTWVTLDYRTTARSGHEGAHPTVVLLGECRIVLADAPARGDALCRSGLSAVPARLRTRFVFIARKALAEICAEEKVEGQCSGVFARYWYNSAANQCERFIYTGCKGNRNRFETDEQCQRTCVSGYDATNEGVGE